MQLPVLCLFLTSQLWGQLLAITCLAIVEGRPVAGDAGQFFSFPPWHDHVLLCSPRGIYQILYMSNYPAMSWDISPPAVSDFIKLLEAGADPMVHVNVRGILSPRFLFVQHNDDMHWRCVVCARSRFLCRSVSLDPGRQRQRLSLQPKSLCSTRKSV